MGARDHGVDGVDGGCEESPEKRGEEEAADDLNYGMEVEEAGVGVALKAASGEALVPGLQGWERWCLHCSTSIDRDEVKRERM